jgi:hypothetical protein
MHFALIRTCQSFLNQYWAYVLAAYGQNRTEPALVAAWRSLDRTGAAGTRNAL